MAFSLLMSYISGVSGDTYFFDSTQAGFPTGSDVSTASGVFHAGDAGNDKPYFVFGSQRVIILFDDANLVLRAFLNTAGTVTYTEQDATHAPGPVASAVQLKGYYGVCQSTQNPNLLYITFWTGSGGHGFIALVPFNMTTMTWGTVLISTLRWGTPPWLGQIGIMLTKYRPFDDAVVIVQGVGIKPSGFPNAVFYAKCFPNGVGFDAAFTGCGDQADDGINSYQFAAVMDANSNLHMYFATTTVAGAPESIQHQVLHPGGALSALQTFQTNTSPHSPFFYYFSGQSALGNAIQLSDGRIAVPLIIDPTGTSALQYSLAIAADASDTPAWSFAAPFSGITDADALALFEDGGVLTAYQINASGLRVSLSPAPFAVETVIGVPPNAVFGLWAGAALVPGGTGVNIILGLKGMKVYPV